MASSSRRSRRSRKEDEPSTTDSEYTMPDYLVEENSEGELVNPASGVIWPARIEGVKKYPLHTSTDASSLPSGEEDDYATSPFAKEMRELWLGPTKESEARAKREKRAARERKLRESRDSSRSKRSGSSSRKHRGRAVDRTRRRSPSPQYVQLSGRAPDESGSESNDSRTAATHSPEVDSIVFQSEEEMLLYERIIKAAAEKTERDKKEKEEEEKKEKKRKERKERKEKERREKEREENERKDNESDASNTSETSIRPVPKGKRDEIERHYIGVRSRDDVDQKLSPGQFFIYYEKPSGLEVQITIDLFIGYMSSTKKIYHFPIQKFKCEGEPVYAVRQTDMDVKMFPSIAALVQHYHTFSHVDPETGRLETFGLPPL